MSLIRNRWALLERVKEARESRSTTSGRVYDLDLADAYRVQGELAGGREIAGYKLGLVSSAKQVQMGLESPIYGRVYPEMILRSPVSLRRFIQPKMEPELALRLGDDLPPGASLTGEWTAAGEVFLAVDFLDSVWDGYKFTIAEVVADNTSGGGFLLGDKPLDPSPEDELRMYLDEDLVSEGPIEALGDVSAHLSWLAREVGGLEAGQVIFLGSPAAAVEARPGTLELRGPKGSVLSAEIEK